MRKIYAITVAAAMCLCSCSDSKYAFVDSFPISGELQPVRTLKYDPVKVNLYGIARAGDYWIASIGDNDYRAAVTDDSLNVIVRTLRTGNGPGEFLYPLRYGTPYTEGDSVIIFVKDAFKGSLNRVATCLTDGKTDVRKIGEVPVMNRTWHPLPDGSVIVNNNENRYFLISSASDTVYFETWTCSTRLMVFDFDMRPEAVYSIEGDVSSFYADPETGLIYINDLDEELIRIYDLSEWLRSCS